MNRLVMFASICCACAGDPSDRPASWTYIHAAIVAPNCATSSCHSERMRAADIVLADRQEAYRLLRDELFVIAGDPSSPLLQLLEGDEVRRMPPDAPLPQADIDLVRAWIEAGAEP